jgi:serine/threonine protein kinase
MIRIVKRIHAGRDSAVFLGEAAGPRAQTVVVKRPHRHRQAQREFNMLLTHVSECHRVPRLAFHRMLHDLEIDWAGTRGPDDGEPASLDEHPRCLAIRYCRPVGPRALPPPSAMCDTDAAHALWPAVANLLDLELNSAVAHCDVCPGNLIRVADNKTVLIDFGASRLKSPTSAEVTAGPPPPPGESVLHTSPETLARGVTADESDVYALGVMLYSLCNGKDHPILASSDPEREARRTRKLLGAFEYDPATMWLGKNAPRAADLARLMLERDPDDRIPIREVAVHPLFRAANSGR